MNANRYSEIRPHLYHLTDRSNLDLIRATGTLLCAADLMKRAGRSNLLRTRRLNHEPLEISGSRVVLRDQEPLRSGNIELTGGFTFEDFVEELNAKVFFWPGNDDGPIPSGKRHFTCYKSESPVMLRCRFQSLLSANPSTEPLFCPYNSGAPRTVNGKKSPRGPTTFSKACDFPRRRSEVVEVTFVRKVVLPPDAELRYSPAGPWQSLF
jgi:uncharacterized protein DUF7002